MGEIVNLKRARKRRAAEEQAREAQRQRSRHGLTKAERLARTREEARRDAVLDAARLDTPPAD